MTLIYLKGHYCYCWTKHRNSGNHLLANSSLSFEL